METVTSSCTLDNELTKIAKNKIKLDKTSSWESSDTKRDQVSKNIINNAITMHDIMLHNVMFKQFELTYPFIRNIESNENNENEFVTCRIVGKRKTLSDFNKYVESKCGGLDKVDHEIDRLMDNSITAHFQLQQQPATTTIVFNGRTELKPLVVKRLAKIGDEINKRDSPMLKLNELEQIIRVALNNPDVRTAKNYLECLKEYAKRTNGVYAVYEYAYNLKGFKDAISKLLEKQGELYQ